jgi:putative endopeptidase
MHNLRPLILASLLALVSAPILGAAQPAAAPNPGFGLDKMDRSVDPRTDFAKYAAGGWYARNEIPSDKARWGGFNELTESNWVKLRGVVETAAANPGAPGGVSQKVGDFYTSAIDTAAIDARGIEPLKAEFAAIAAAKTTDELFAVAAQMHLRLGNPFLGLAFYPDQKQSDRYGFYLFQGGMSLPSKEYYTSEKFARERWEFVGHVAKMFELAGDARPVAYQNAETIFAFEKALAANAKLPVELRDRIANYNKMTIAAAIAAYPGVPLATLIAGLGVPAAVTEVIIGQPKFLEGLSAVLATTPLADLKTYVRWTSSPMRPRTSRLRLKRRISASTAQCSTAPQSRSRAGSTPPRSSMRRLARRSVNSTWRSTIRPRPRPAWMR